MATVWCATDTLLDRRVAIKLPGAALADDPEAAGRFTREARTAARLSGHRHIVSIFDVGTTADGVPYIVMEYLPGGTVADALRTGSVTPELAVRWIAETAAALDHAHHEGVVHRDVKPANLLLDRGAGSIHVADFGIARASTEDTISSTGRLFGTAGYLAPEQVLGERATPASDRYALAVLTYELLTGRRPFSGDELLLRAGGRQTSKPAAPSRVNRRLPRQVDRVIARGLAREPAARWTTAEAFAEALSDALGMELTEALPADPPTRRLATAPAAATPVRPATATPARPVSARPAAIPTPAAAAVPPPRNPILTGSRTGRPRRAPRAAALTALTAAVAVVAVALASGTGSGTHPQRTGPARGTTDASILPAPAAAPTARPAPRHPGPSVTTASSTATASPSQTAATSTSTSATAAATPSSPSGLEASGHALMNSGRYTAAIPVLQRAVAGSSPSSLTYAYALYDLGRSLRLAGDPGAAVPVLARRLQIPNQTGVVRQELVMAIRESRPPATGGASPGHPRGHHGRRGDGRGSRA